MNMSDFLKNMCANTGYAKIDEAVMSDDEQILKNAYKELGKIQKWVGNYNGFKFKRIKPAYVKGELVAQCNFGDDIRVNLVAKQNGGGFTYLLDDDYYSVEGESIDKIGTLSKRVQGLIADRLGELDEAKEDAEATISVNGDKVSVTVDGETFEISKKEAEDMGILEGVQVDAVARGAKMATLNDEDDDFGAKAKVFMNEARHVKYRILDAINEGKAELPLVGDVGAMYSYKGDVYILTGELNTNYTLVNADDEEIVVSKVDFAKGAKVYEDAEEDEEDFGVELDEAKEEHYIFRQYDKNGKQTDFDRLAQKTVKGALKYWAKGMCKSSLGCALLRSQVKEGRLASVALTDSLDGDKVVYKASWEDFAREFGCKID